MKQAEREVLLRAELHHNRSLLKKYFFKGLIKHHLKAKQEKEFVASQSVMKQKVNMFINKLKANMEEATEMVTNSPFRDSRTSSSLNRRS